MMRNVLLALAGLLLALGLVSPAEAATHNPPSAPRTVVASTQGQVAGALRVSWGTPRNAGSSAVEVYGITYAKASQPSRQTWVAVPAAKRSVVLRGLAVGQRYVVQVAAYNRWGRGPWARVTAAPAHDEALFAVDEKAHALVRFATTGAPRAKTVLANVTGVDDLEVDRTGNAYIAAGGKITAVPASGATRVLGSGTQVETDPAGNVYLGGDAGVVKLTPAGVRTQVTTDGVSSLSVDGRGAVTAATEGYGPSLTTYAPGTKPVRRDLSGQIVQGGRILGDRRGTVYDNANSAGGAGYRYWVRLAAGSTATPKVGTRNAEFGATVAANDSFYLAESGSFCPETSENHGTCKPDREIRSIARYAPDGHLVSDVATSGFGTRRYLGLDIAVGSAGTLYAADRAVGHTPALVRVAPAGGAAQLVAAGEYGLLAVG